MFAVDSMYSGSCSSTDAADPVGSVLGLAHANFANMSTPSQQSRGTVLLYTEKRATRVAKYRGFGVHSMKT